MESPIDTQWLHQAAKRLENSPEFVAARLFPFLRQAGLTEQDVAAMLRCSHHEVVKLALCRWSDGSQEDFHLYVKRLAKYLGIDVGPLANLLRQLAFAGAVRQWSDSKSPSFLMAAREREEPNHE